MIHAGTGNLRPIIVLAEGQEFSGTAGQPATDSSFPGRRLRLGGTIGRAHVGVLTCQWMRAEPGDDLHRLGQQLWTDFDSTGILNPGKAFECRSD